MEFNIPFGKVIRVFTSTNLCVTGDFQGTFNGTLLMKYLKKQRKILIQ